MRERRPCCGSRTLDRLKAFEMCPVCFWEDDGQTDADADQVRGGPNGTLSLTQARKNYREFGASERQFLGSVRRPTEYEV
jgi:Cysteine-rich CPCC